VTRLAPQAARGGAVLYRILIFACWFGLSLYWKLSARKAKPAVQTQAVKNRLARFPVWLGFLLLTAAGVCPSWEAMRVANLPAAAWLGVILCASGMVFAVWARRALGDDWSQDVELKQGHRLVLQGPYSLVRHPIYTAHLLIALGSAITFDSWLGYAAVASFFVGFSVKLVQEEELLMRNFPDKYPEYRMRVKALIPWIL
jgi:protein-S-isoprenylcysteine O-methyltransferase Ste14